MPAVSTSTYGVALIDERRVDGVARRAGRLVNEDALGPDHRVHQGRLAHVRPSHDGDMDGWRAGRRRRRGSREALAHRLEQRGHTPAVLGRDRDRIAEAEPVEITEALSWAAWSTLLAASTTGRFARRRIRAISRSSAVAPSRASTTNRTTSPIDGSEHLTAHAVDQGLLRRRIEAPVSITVACQRSKLTRP